MATKREVNLIREVMGHFDEHLRDEGRTEYDSLTLHIIDILEAIIYKAEAARA